MLKQFAFISLLIIVAVSSGLAGQNEAEINIEGIWKGPLKIGQSEQGLIVYLSRDSGGTMKATIDSPDEGIKGIAVKDVKYEKDVLILEIEPSKNYKGKLSKDGSRIEGKLTTSRMQVPLTLERADEAHPSTRPQDPPKPYPYIAEDVYFTNKEAKVTFAGTLTIPKGKGPFPSALLISGTGQHDRNSAMMDHRPFLVLADHLTCMGIAVLRYDDRGTGYSTGLFSKATTKDFAEDAIAGITYLRSRTEIDHDLIGLVGHSEGSVVAAMVAARLQNIAYVVMLSGMGISGDMTLIRQTEAIAKASGIDEEIIGANISLQKKIYAVLKNSSNHQTLEKKLHNIYLSQVSALGQGINEEMELQIQEHISQVTSPWFLYFVKYDPQADLARVKCPIFILFGEKDLQTPPQFHIPPIKQSFRPNGTSQTTVKIMPGLNHLFQNAETGLVSEYNKISETISPSVLQLIGEWILEKSWRVCN